MSSQPATISTDTDRVQFCATPSGRAELVSSFGDAPIHYSIIPSGILLLTTPRPFRSVYPSPIPAVRA
jgi:hypothetical protein